MRALIANALEVLAILALVVRDRVLAADVTGSTAHRHGASSGHADDGAKSGDALHPCVQCGAYQGEAICDICCTRIMCADAGADA